MAHALLCLIVMIEQLFASPNYQATKQLLDVATMRHEALATNLSNIETPGYKRIDLPKEFAQEFATHLRSGGGTAPTPKLVQDATASSRRKDGNTVQLDKELLAMTKNEAEYDMLTEFVSGSIKQLKLAITGRSNG